MEPISDPIFPRYLHALVLDTGELIAKHKFGRSPVELSATERNAVSAETQQLLKQNRYAVESQSLRFTEPEVFSYRSQIETWTDYFSEPETTPDCRKIYPGLREISQLTAFFAWTAWASVANRPGKSYSYTNNFPYDPMR